MSVTLLPIAYTLFVWWFSTGAILYLDSLPRATYRYSMAGATLLLPLALYGLAVTRTDVSASGAYAAFTCAVLVWGWQEVAFLLGYVTGPRQSPRPAGSSEWQRFVGAVQVVLYHEFALLVLGIAVFAITWSAPNNVGAWTFAILWAMRQSAKLNLFLGVRNRAEELLPAQLRYVASYFARRPMNPLFPVSVTAGTIVAAFVWESALAPDASVFAATAATFAGTLLALAIIEHWFLVIPIPTTALWNWSLRPRAAAAAVDAALAPALPADEK